MHCTICTICTMEGKVQKVQKVQGKKMTWDSWDSETVEWGVIPFKQGKVSSVSRVSCNFLYYRHPMPGNGQKKKRGIQSRGTTKNEKAVCSVVELAGVLPIDWVIELSRKRILIAHAWSMLFHLLSREGIYLLPYFRATSAQGLLNCCHLKRDWFEMIAVMVNDD